MRSFLPMFSRWQIRVLLIATVLFGAGIGLLMAAIPNQGRTQFFGSSGGNVNDISKSFCCSGTLGSLVKDSSGVQYILSNNHVLADTDQAAPGENISQPGLVDNNCRPATTVAHFTVAPHLGTNVDAALAKLVAGTMNSSGSILGVGVPNPAPVSAKINMGVAKSGRTTGLTCGSVQSVNTSVRVQYQKGCNQGQKFTISYANQVVVASSTFSAGGDSGSLIVSRSAAHPTALLFAGRQSKRSEEHTSELQSQSNLVCRLLLEKKKLRTQTHTGITRRHTQPLARSSKTRFTRRASKEWNEIPADRPPTTRTAHASARPRSSWSGPLF